ncbi:hypothetical protein [Microbaculum marinum]|uniref:DUF4239 domain-containing protein n=1 Tax=Microbaculum marinum TaxID=1764581 RepID=A0AAW9RMR5_9HYPH
MAQTGLVQSTSVPTAAAPQTASTTGVTSLEIAFVPLLATLVAAAIVGLLGRRFGPRSFRDQAWGWGLMAFATVLLAWLLIILHYILFAYGNGGVTIPRDLYLLTSALTAAVFTMIGWFVAHENSRQRDTELRDEKIRDIQSALLAEIQSNFDHFYGVDLERSAATMRERLQQESFTPFVPRDSTSKVFDAVIAEIHILPHGVIAPTVAYYKQAASVSHFIDDMHGEGFAGKSPAIKLEMYVDYLGMIKKAQRLASEAIAALTASLEENEVPAGQRDTVVAANSPASVRNARQSRSRSKSASGLADSSKPPRS